MPNGVEDRAYRVRAADRLAAPGLGNLARGRLRAARPVEVFPAGAPEQRDYSHLEAVGRLLAGLAAWLEVALPPGPERGRQARYPDLARRGLDAATDPRSRALADAARAGRTPAEEDGLARFAHATRALRAPVADERQEGRQRAEPRGADELSDAVIWPDDVDADLAE